MDEIFELCKGNLGKLSTKYKRWLTLKEYRLRWYFVRKSGIRERICEGNMAADYLLSLYLWLLPSLTLADAHKHIYLQNITAIIKYWIN